MSPRFKVLCALVLVSPLSIKSAVNAQPPDAANTQNGAEQPLLPITLAEWDRHNGLTATLTFKLENATASDIAAEVEKQSGVALAMSGGRLLGDGGAVPRFSVEATGQPFWQAVRQWNRGESKLRIAEDRNNPGGWMLTDDVDRTVRPQNQPRITAGPCELFLNNVGTNTNRSLQLDQPNPVRSTQASLSLQGLVLFDNFDPRWPMTLGGLIAETQSAVDDRGRALTANPSYSHPNFFDRGIMVDFNLKAPETDAKQLSSFKGRLRLAMIMRREKWEIDLNATPQAEKTFQGDGVEITYAFGGITTRANGSSAKFIITRKPVGAGPRRVFKTAGPWNQSPIGGFNEAIRAIRVFDGAGNLLSQGGASGSGDGNPTLDLDINFTAIPNTPPEKSAPAKIIIDVPLEYREIQIPFEFKDLPLP